MHEWIHAEGHENVAATHASTFEVTTDDYLTPAGDCILAIGADRAPSDFDPGFVSACRDAGARMEAIIRADDRKATVTGRGHPDLAFASDRSAVVRTSEYVDDRTVMIGADAAAADLDRGLVDALADGAELTVELTVQS
ncbi:MAG: DUF371 domain-containing protein [Halobacteriales archaeon]